MHEAEEIFVQAKRILAPGGRICLDTPNALLARLISPHSFLHPEHKIEYEPQQLIQLMEKSGLKVEKALAISPMPVSYAMKRFCKLELIESVGVTNEVDTGYSFYLEASI